MTASIQTRASKSNVVAIDKKATRLPRVKKADRKTLHSSTKAAAIGILAVGLVLVALSLAHLAQGIQLVTGSELFGAWAMAIGIDLGFVALEIAMLTAPDDIRQAVAKYANPAIVGTLTISAVMNAFAFAAHAQGWMTLPAIILGCAIPALIFALTKTAATLAFHKH
jgi:preprotein translocase subunit Sss1